MGIWFTFKKEKKEEKSKVLDRGSVVTIGDTTGTSYVVSDVFRMNAKKWHMSLVYDNLAWIIVEKESEKYPLVVKEVEMNRIEESSQEIQVFVKSYGSIEYGFNVRATYTLVKNRSQIKSNILKINI